MKLFFEEYPYDLNTVNECLRMKLSDCLPDSSLYQYSEKQDTVKFTCVGYFYNTELSDSIFILPKVFLNVETVGTEKKTSVFSGIEANFLSPENIINLSSDSKLSSNTWRFINSMSLWLFQSIERYSEQFGKGNIMDGNLQRVVTTPGDTTETWLDTVVSMIKFYKEHRNLFTFIAKNREGGTSRVDWKKTISHKNTYIQSGAPIYTELITKTKAINFDEELIVLFLSAMNYLRSSFCFSKIENIGFNLLRPVEIQRLIDSGKGLLKVKALRHKYFSDDLVQLWNLMRLFFVQAYENKNKKTGVERTIIRKYDRVFEHMIDCLIGDALPKALEYMKHQDDGKNIDHLYLDNSLLPGLDKQIFFIGDSKYYKETETDGSSKIGTNSVAKQFTYAKNVIQYCMNIILNEDHAEEESTLRDKIFYRDDLTEGYNITPNFFIHGRVFKENLSDDNSRFASRLEQVDNIEIRENRQWEDRLFDRDTLLLQTFNINFLYVLSTYVLRSDNKNVKEKIRSEIRKSTISQIANQYIFVKLTPYDLEAFVNANMKTCIGRMISYNKDKEDIVLLAFKRNNQSLNSQFNDKLDELIALPHVHRVERYSIE